MTRRAPIIGEQVDTGGELAIDFNRLLVSRLLVQANSGGGKSWALRRLLEQTYGLAQQIIIDPEDEFYTLREKYDYILAGRDGGDCPAEPRSAHLLARQLLELNVSCIIGIYELGKAQRREFVKRFLTALVNAPKHFWHPALIVVDEAHDFCPEGKPSESSEAVIDLATKGRKRGFCAVLATQRISKLSKDAAAELNNKLVGRCVLDIDRKRAGEELGFTAKEDMLKLRDLQDGEFFAFGTALSRDVVKIKTGPVLTTHPDPLKKGAATPPPAPSDKVRALLAKLADLPQEAVQEAQDIAGLRKQVADLQRQLRQAERPASAAPAAKTIGDSAALRKQVAALERTLAGASKEAEKQIARAVKAARLEALEHGKKLGAWERRRDVARELDRVMAPLNSMQVRLAEIGEPPAAPEHWSQAPEISLAAPTESRGPSFGRATPSGESRVQTPRSAPSSASANGASEDLGRGERVCLIAIAQHDNGVTREQLTVLTGYKRSTRNTYLQRLGASGLIEGQGERILATDQGIAVLGDDFEPLPLGAALRERVLSELPEGERRILELAIERYPEAVDRESISESTGYTRSSRNTYLQRLGARELIKAEAGGQVRAAAQLFD
jgi:uncharacterized protein DUF87